MPNKLRRGRLFLQYRCEPATQETSAHPMISDCRGGLPTWLGMMSAAGPIAPFHCDAEFGRYRCMTDMDQAASIGLDWEHAP
jgi:hypothetical protein